MEDHRSDGSEDLRQASQKYVSSGDHDGMAGSFWDGELEICGMLFESTFSHSKGDAFGKACDHDDCT